jgi:3-isopropylmalate dehydrogenase
MAQARRALEALVSLDVVELPFGAAAIRSHGDPLPPETLAACRDADAILKAPVGDPEFDGAEVRPEQGIIRLRQELDVYANLRPAARGAIDLVIVRELVGGLYYGARGVREDGTVFDTCEYHPRQVERIAMRAFELARTRRGHVTSVDKANVLDTSRMWRRVATEVASGYPEIQLEHMLADNAAMQLVERPERFDVMVMENMFGDILSDLAAAVTGGLGLAPSASLGDSGPGIFEPVHGSAPDIAGQGVANPTAMLRSTSLMLELGLDQPEAGRRLAAAVEVALAAAPTADLGGTATSAEFGDAVLEAIEAA